jgi:hypothetical protein
VSYSVRKSLAGSPYQGFCQAVSAFVSFGHVVACLRQALACSAHARWFGHSLSALTATIVSSRPQLAMATWRQLEWARVSKVAGDALGDNKIGLSAASPPAVRSTLAPATEGTETHATCRSSRPGCLANREG